MPFFEEVDALNIVEMHIRKIQTLEEKAAERLAKAYRESRRRLQDRLLAIPGDKFTAQQLRGALLQIDTALEAMASGMSKSMMDSGDLIARAGAEHIQAEINRFDDHFLGAITPINVNAVAIASDTNNLLVSKYQSSLEAYSEEVRSQLSQALTNAAIEQIPYSEIVRRIGQFFIAEEWKIHRLARTELHQVYNLSKMKSMEALAKGAVPDLKKTLIHPMDSRTGKDSKYANKLNLIVPITQPFRYKWQGKERVYMTPPDRPNDRSILVPYRDSYGEA